MEGIKARIKRLCNLMEPSISVMELESILGFGNGAIGKWEKTDRVPYNRIVAVAEYLHTTPEYLMTGETKTGTPVEAPDDSALKFALFGDTAEIDDADLEDVKRYAAFVKERKLAKKNGAT